VTLYLVIAVLLVAIAWSHAQSLGSQRVTPMVLSGSDIGFRVEAMKGTTPVGRLVVRMNGQWVEPEYPLGVKQLTVR
jgi:hypothetical protein